MKKMKQIGGQVMQVAGAVTVVVASTVQAVAQTDIGSTITTVNGYWTSAEALGVGVLLFVLGRRVVKKI